MMKMTRHFHVVVLIVALAAGGRILAADNATGLAEARAAVEANLKTPAGKAYDQQLGKEFMDKQLSTMKRCKASAGNNLDSFWILMKLDKDGAVKEVLLHPTTKMGTCARETLLKSAFSPPPKPQYWVSIFMKLSH
ncbi:MAG TPA: hypothetical protein VFU57_10690 [Candidatus Acidoferrales bacterium]|nr:hypothetical protein [Candidatus Acidoferrales bacterium]